jgi:hypothetical protein
MLSQCGIGFLFELLFSGQSSALQISRKKRKSTSVVQLLCQLTILLSSGQAKMAVSQGGLW